ncbi:hypothetical protein [uncultured Xanthomonas sp.]|uniref:hypothetical protein n=1 Tax=uncultured Xanthomonas sp. TaxID=152831 RepID=UPI0025D7617C|nr:hypothetical protein [uncultured Xanthomonas sp.]
MKDVNKLKAKKKIYFGKTKDITSHDFAFISSEPADSACDSGINLHLSFYGGRSASTLGTGKYFLFSFDV